MSKEIQQIFKYQSIKKMRSHLMLHHMLEIVKQQQCIAL
jgi:hypothetical protein